jgi:RNA polymerase sigma-70 factor (ECF subfamily)
MRTLDPQSLSKHVDRLYRAAWALCGSREDAEDLVQETFARVLARPRRLSGDEELYYLMRVLRNTFLTSRRTASRRPVTVATLEDVVTADPRPSGQPERALEVQEVYATIAQLPEDRRLALVAVDVLGLSYREAARALRVREATITTRLFRARKQVARELNEPQPTARQPQTPAIRREETRAAGVLPGRGTR